MVTDVVATVKVFLDDNADPRWDPVGRWSGVLAAAAGSAGLVLHHTNPWIGPLGSTGTALFLVAVAACYLPYAIHRVLTRGRFTPGLLLIPVIAVTAVAGATSPMPAATRWSHSEAAFTTVNRTLPPGWPPKSSLVAGEFTAGLFDVNSVVRNDGDTYYVIQGNTDGDSCQGGVANMPHGPAGSFASRTRHLNGPWYAFTACWD